MTSASCLKSFKFWPTQYISNTELEEFELNIIVQWVYSALSLPRKLLSLDSLLVLDPLVYPCETGVYNQPEVAVINMAHRFDIEKKKKLLRWGDILVSVRSLRLQESKNTGHQPSPSTCSFANSKNYPAWIVNPQPQLLRIHLFFL